MPKNRKPRDLLGRYIRVYPMGPPPGGSDDLRENSEGVPDRGGKRRIIRKRIEEDDDAERT